MAILIAAAGALISGFFGSRKQKNEAKAAEKRQKLSDLYQGYQNDLTYQRELTAQRRSEEAIAGYRGFYKGDRQFTPPVMTDPNSVRPVDPYAPKQGRG